MSALAFASDLIGLGSAAVLLVPVFGHNDVAKAIARLRQIAARADGAGGSSIRDAAGQLAESMRLRKDPWSAADETWLRLGAVALATSFALKLLARAGG